MFPKNVRSPYDPDGSNPQIYYYTGPPGPPGPFGPPGRPGSLNDTAVSYTYAQLAHVLAQIIRYYPTTVLRAYATGFTFAGLEGTPVELFSSPDATYGGLFVVNEGGEVGAMPLQSIASITFLNGVPYNLAINYLSKPVFTQGFDTNIVTAIHDYLPLGTTVEVHIGTVIDLAGVVYKNVYGMLVVADDMLGTNPSFVPVTNITGILPTFAGSTGLALKTSAANPGFIISHENK